MHHFMNFFDENYSKYGSFLAKFKNLFELSKFYEVELSSGGTRVLNEEGHHVTSKEWTMIQGKTLYYILKKDPTNL